MACVVTQIPQMNTADANASSAVERREGLRSIRAEYGEMPCLALTRPQVERLWSLAPKVAETLLADLVAAGFLRCNAGGRYVRADLSRN